MTTTDNYDTSAGLLQGVRDLRNESAWGSFLTRYRPFIERCCRDCGLPRDEVEDAAAEILAHLVVKMQSFVYDPRQKFRAWLATVVRHKVADLERSRERHPGGRGSGDSDVRRALEQLPAPADTDGPGPDHERWVQYWSALAAAAQTRVQAAVSSRTWQAFWLRDIEGLPTRDVARQLGLSEPGVHMARGRARRKLREEGERMLDEGEVGRTD